MASSLSAGPSQESYPEADCDQGGEWPKIRSLLTPGGLPVRPTLNLSAMSNGSSPPASY